MKINTYINKYKRKRNNAGNEIIISKIYEVNFILIIEIEKIKIRIQFNFKSKLKLKSIIIIQKK